MTLGKESKTFVMQLFAKYTLPPHDGFYLTSEFAQDRKIILVLSELLGTALGRWILALGFYYYYYFM